MFKEGMLALVGQGFIETIYMTVISTALAYIIGLPLGLVLVVTDKDGIHPIPWLNSLLGMIINFFRSIPFLILLIALMPFTKMVVGTVIGSKAAIVGLWIAAAPFIARMVESSLKEVEIGVVEAAQSMGALPVSDYDKGTSARGKALSLGRCGNQHYHHFGLFRNGRYRRRRRLGCHCHQLWLL